MLLVWIKENEGEKLKKESIDDFIFGDLIQNKIKK